MSDRYVSRLRRISDELDGTTKAIALLSRMYDRNEAALELRDAHLSRSFLYEIARNLEITYFVRLTAEFEGILKDHLRSNHPQHRCAAGGIWKIDEFLSAVWRAEGLRRNAALRAKLGEVRDYRNSIAHRSPPVVHVTFREALKRYNTFLAQLPDPRG